MTKFIIYVAILILSGTYYTMYLRALWDRLWSFMLFVVTILIIPISAIAIGVLMDEAMTNIKGLNSLLLSSIVFMVSISYMIFIPSCLQRK